MGLSLSDPCVLYKSLCHPIDDVTTHHLELFQMTAPRYESGLLLIVIRISVEACIDVTLYDELFNHLHNREKFLSLLVTKDNFDRCSLIQVCSSSSLYLLTDLWQGTHQVRYTAWHTVESMAKA